MPDPRQHHYVRRVVGDRIVYRCRCVTEIAPPFGALRSVSKCRRHAARQRDPATLDEAYYRELGALDADAPQRYVAELTEALGEIPEAWDVWRRALEVGCGISPYFSAIRARGWLYNGLDPCRWAANWMGLNRAAAVRSRTLDDHDLGDSFGFILAAHSIEHMADAPNAIQKCADLLIPRGELWIVIPDDSDPLNSDHLWFFSPDSLRACVEAAGLSVKRFAVHQRVPHEKFIYVRAIKP
jgi:SAM-dependent methyltransferase